MLMCDRFIFVYGYRLYVNHRIRSARNPHPLPSGSCEITYKRGYRDHKAVNHFQRRERFPNTGNGDQSPVDGLSSPSVCFRKARHRRLYESTVDFTVARVDARLRVTIYVDRGRDLRTLRSQAHRLTDLRSSDRIDIHSRVTEKDHGALRDYVLIMEVFMDMERVIPNINRDARFNFENMNAKDLVFLAIIWISVLCLIGLSIVIHNNALSRRRRNSVSVYRLV